MVGLGIALCALSCSVPLLIGVGVGGAALVAAYSERVGVALLGLGVVGLVWGMVRRRLRASAEAGTQLDSPRS